jgi:protein phosphatase
MKLDAFGVTHVGMRRDSNEDELLVDGANGLFAVADGMGGHAAGEIASRIAIDSIAASVRAHTPEPARIDFREASTRLRQAVGDANRRICESIRDHQELSGMGTTVAVVLACRDGAVIAHVGDSRVYLLREDKLHRLTSDHSWVNEQVKLGLLSDDAAQRHPMRNIVTRALGSRPDVLVDVGTEPTRPGDVLLLCSDGLNTMVDDAAIREILLRSGGEPERACRELVQAANARGGEDNVTVVVVGLA